MICFSSQGVWKCGKCGGNLDSCLGADEHWWAAHRLSLWLSSLLIQTGGISCSRTRWVVKSSVAGWFCTDITWICKVYSTFSPVKHWKWRSSFPSFLWPYTAVIVSPGHDFLLKPVKIPLIHQPSPVSLGSFHLAHNTLLWPPAPGSAMTRQGWSPAFQCPALPGHKSWEVTLKERTWESTLPYSIFVKGNLESCDKYLPLK